MVAVHIRDSEVRSGPVLTVTPDAWAGLVRLAVLADDLSRTPVTPVSAQSHRWLGTHVLHGPESAVPDPMQRCYFTSLARTATATLPTTVVRT
ncbi:DUF397 domain-containing protein [Streptomyces sp. B21-083]|uniref:DUF397 domain-containing protein n=1 Tax=Streptomyces sp. B21-083 TaxID=3039410 RepID=UPI003FA6DD21